MNVTADQFFDKALKNPKLKDLDDMIQKFCTIRKLNQCYLVTPKIFILFFFVHFNCASKSKLNNPSPITQSQWI